MVCLSYYWFRGDERITGRLLKFLGVVIMMVCVTISSGLFRLYLLTDTNNTSSVITNMEMLGYQIDLDIMTVFDWLLPCWFILKTNRQCYKENQHSYETLKTESILSSEIV